MRIIVIYDNKTFIPEWKSGWGFSCLIESKGEYCLFDTGEKEESLYFNLKKSNISLEKIEYVTFSHEHWDHIGGIDVIDKFQNARVFVPYHFSKGFKDKVKNIKGSFKVIGMEIEELIPNVFTTPTFNRFLRIKEVSLIIKTKNGLGVITGCAHPGILFIVRNVKKMFSEDVKFILGGFHLKSSSEFSVKRIVNELLKEGVEYFAPCHCTGNKAIEVFKCMTGDKFIEIGSGKEIEF